MLSEAAERRSWIVFVITFMLNTVLVVAPAYSNSISLNDSKAVGTIWHKALTLGSDIAQTAQAVTESFASSSSLTTDQFADAVGISQCFSRLIHATDGLTTRGNVLTITALLAAEMKDPRDESLALQVLRSSLTNLDQELALYRHEATQASARCRNDAAVNVKAQAVLDLISEAEDTFKGLAQKVGAVQR